MRKGIHFLITNANSFHSLTPPPLPKVGYVYPPSPPPPPPHRIYASDWGSEFPLATQDFSTGVGATARERSDQKVGGGVWVGGGGGWGRVPPPPSR